MILMIESAAMDSADPVIPGVAAVGATFVMLGQAWRGNNEKNS